ncbi:vWA domain-containing protein [Nocardioides dongxiaopingii]|uniref:vWA domain-containing protein n=1 Tax=Nocardioides dongxiaopingii TaxID=2576036 RepID=UPI0010C76A89|nr:VWA domain-containing protein [Nocardioides dongxiaopingii]
MSTPSAPGTTHEVDEVLLAFTRALRAAGVPVTHDRAAGFLAAVATVGLADRRATYVAGRATLCSSPDDLLRHDQVFEAFFDHRSGLPRERPAAPREQPVPADLALDEQDGDGDGEEREDVVRALASDLETLRHRDVAAMTAAEKHRLAGLFSTLRPRPPMRRTVRQEPWRRGQVDAARTIRASLRLHGEPAPIQWRHRRLRPRRVVLLVDVSGSMSGYADALLRLAHTLTRALVVRGGRVETFTVGTRLTHLTRALRTHDVERALVAAGEAVPDWSGGTRLGETLKVFLDRWGRRGTARGAVVVVFSDGWERGDAVLLGEQVRRLRAVAHRVVWVNPHRGKTGYEPVQQGILAVLPHVDALVAGHTLATYEELVEVVARA